MKFGSNRYSKPWTYSEILTYLQKNNSKYILLSKEYKTQNDRLDWKCNTCHNKFNRSWKTILLTLKGKKNGGCTYCSKRFIYTISDIKKKLKLDNRPIKSLETTYSNNKALMSWKCLDPKCGHEWKNSWKSINGVKGTNPQGCKKCYENTPKYTIDELKEKLSDANINAKLLSTQYKNFKNTKLKFKCLNTDCGHIWSTQWKLIYDNEYGCPVCSSCGLTEKGIKKFLDKVFGSGTFVKVRPDFLINPKNGAKLEIDCYSEKLNIAIEIQGEQHYKYNKFFHRTKKAHQEQIERDIFKKNTIINKGINFIELDISSKRKIDKIKESLKNELIKINIKIPKSFDKNDIPRYHKNLNIRSKKVRNISKSIPWNIKLIKKETHKTNFKPLFNVYKNNREMLNWKCKKCNYMFKKPLAKILHKIKNNLKCKKCTSLEKGYNLDKVKKTIKNKKIRLECLSNEYKNAVTPLKWKCTEKLCKGEFHKDWSSVNRSSGGGCGYCSLNLKRNTFLLKKLQFIFGLKNVIVEQIPILDKFKNSNYILFYIPSKNMMVELDNWYDNTFLKKYHKNINNYNNQQNSNIKKDKYLKEKGFIHIKIPLKANIHFYDIESKLIKLLKEKNIIINKS